MYEFVAIVQVCHGKGMIKVWRDISLRELWSKQQCEHWRRWLCRCCAELGRQEKDGKAVHGDYGVVARGTVLVRLAGLGSGIVKSAREKGDVKKADLNDRSNIGGAVPLKDSVGSASSIN
ncbi:uncharacterized protein MONOS_3821 [Monocercomonoides exilis]|uniref:uncharacterized protein n=1 Tax=Monocercomonoides exilis TaxID=2049356 RepID=UPI0035596262|nr:hypothetical protein MONOS_3821 [Monocercomonoides exilis]|eukprot:MONOS_3821.1-p1 / transcript=MONOS_3821.1 / gene=MONOS_3821 / organism=Monocercomonoides_exilis_PA203 / gene_product=unspecified product / transcript_product=unspecified product / location=Mono_scaffold00094:22065-22923(+) / protein_length=120 / sequence_SO=supercontig / SO=protein_coding / is_pseudo=false